MLDEIKKFHESGGGLYIWADNIPAVLEANQVLQHLLSVQLIGYTPADKNLTLGDPKIKGKIYFYFTFSIFIFCDYQTCFSLHLFF